MKLYKEKVRTTNNCGKHISFFSFLQYLSVCLSVFVFLLPQRNVLRTKVSSLRELNERELILIIVI